MIPEQEAFDALADPTRRAILDLLATHDELPAGEIADRIGHVGRTAVSSHLRILRKSGLITERREGRYRYLSLQPDGPMRAAAAFLQGLLDSALPSPLPSGTEPVVGSNGDATSGTAAEEDNRQTA